MIVQRLSRVLVGSALALTSWPIAAEPAVAGQGASCTSPEVVTPFAAGVDIPESVTTDRMGNLYISLGSSVLRRTVAGDLAVFATLPLPIFALGVKVGPDDCVYTASTSLSEIAGAFVWRMCQPGSVEPYAELDPAGGPNDLAFDGQGNLFVTDPVLGRIWEVAPGSPPRVFSEHPLLAGDPSDPALVFRPLGVNGIALDAQDRFVYVSNTDQGSVVRLGLRSDEPEPSVFVQDPLLRGADGIAFDRSGKLFVAVNGSDSLVSISRSRDVRVVATGAPLDSPSSVAFGSLRSEHHWLYVTSSAFSRTLGLRPGAPQPALLRIDVAVPGLLLP